MSRARRAASASGGPELVDLACVCATARQAARVLTQLYDSRLRGAGMQAPQFALLTALNARGASSQVALGRGYGLDKTTVSRNLKWLSRKGWIAPLSGGDGRTRQFTLTAEGKRRLAAALPEWRKAQTQLRAGMSEEQWNAMFQAFRTVAQTARSLHRRSAQPPKRQQVPSAAR